MAEPIADQSALDKFRNSVRDFQARYAEFSSNAYGASIARTGDNALMLEYGQTLARMRTVNNAINSVLSAYQSVREYVGLGAIPLIPLAVIGGVSITVVSAIKTIDAFMLRAGVRRLQLENPRLTIAQATAQYNAANQSTFGKTLDTMQTAMTLGALAILFFWFRR